ncbi:hypothetical protein D3C87_1336610 [compost metagenome]
MIKSTLLAAFILVLSVVYSHASSEQVCRSKAKESAVKFYSDCMESNNLTTDSLNKKETIKKPALSVSKIKELIIKDSIENTPGNCPCPYHGDRRGRACGGRSAYSRPGGYSPKCYPDDISNAEVEIFRQRLEE